MRTAAPRVFPVLFCAFLLCPLLARAAGPEQDLFEERALNRAIERAVEVHRFLTKSDRALWVKEMEAAFPDKIGKASKEEEYGVWFKLLAGEAEEWKRDGTSNKSLLELYDRAAKQMGLGPVPSIKKSEFLRYARNVLGQGDIQNALDTKDEADKVFRVLDRDGDGVLTPDEWTSKLRDDKAKADGDGNGKIDKNEYRESFQRRVTAAAEILAKTDPKAAAKAGNAPGWFAEVDTDKDGQIALHEWRKAGKPVELFLKMDLNGDGLLTPDEYARYVKMTEEATSPKQP